MEKMRQTRIESDFMITHGVGSNGESELTAHSWYELLFVLDGRIDLLSRAGVYHCSGNALLLIPPGVEHCNMVVGDSYQYRRYILQWKTDFLSDLPHDVLSSFPNERETYIELTPDECERVICDFERLNEKRDDVVCGKLLAALILYDMSKYRRMVLPAPHRNSEYISDVVKYVSEHYQNKLIAAEVAAHFGVSRTKLLCDFKKRMGVTFCYYIQTERIRHACQCLSEGRGIAETAYLCGYESETYFRQSFKAYMKMTPSEFRKRGEI